MRFHVLRAELSFSFVRELENKKTNKIPDAVTFECELSLDDAAVEWYRGDRRIKHSDKHNVDSRGAVHRLTINDIDAKDAGEYTAVVKNKSTKANLTVEGAYTCSIPVMDRLLTCIIIYV